MDERYLGIKIGNRNKNERSNMDRNVFINKTKGRRLSSKNPLK